jgi:hypothetical protein
MNDPELAIPQEPDLDSFRAAAHIRFEEYMGAVYSALRKRPGYSEVRILLLLDEFSHVYAQIQRGHIQRDFMKYWKALLEKGWFGSVLVGQDTMPSFMEDFRNEFQIAFKERISYLDKAPAEQLVQEPIMILDEHSNPVESRYKGKAVERVLDYTAGSPYFTQIFCKRLVEYMNERNAPYVGDPDIDRVKDALVSGHNCMTKGDFDALLTTGDKDMNPFSEADVVAVLRKIAIVSKRETLCNRASIDVAVEKTDDIIEDLVRREVLKEQGTGKYKIPVGLFRDWLLVNS